MKSKRYYISKLRGKLKEVNADSIFTNKFLYSVLEEHAAWLIPRELKTGKLLENKTIFQKIPCIHTMEVDKIQCPFPLEGMKIYRTKSKLPEMWQAEKGPIILRVSSIDNSTDFTVISSTSWEDKNKTPFRKMIKNNYCLYEGNYLWFPIPNNTLSLPPKRIMIRALFKERVEQLDCDCIDTPDCKRFLDEPFYIPEKIEAELIDKAFQQLAAQTGKIMNDENINTNTNIRN